MQKLKTNKGITLIALVITIILMLILVGVTVIVALNGGLFNTAKQGADQTQLAGESEQIYTAAMGAVGEDGKVDFTKLDNNLPEGFEGSQGTYTSSKSGNKYKVSRNGTITLVKPLEIGVSQYKTSTISIAPIIDYEEFLTEEEAIKILGQAFGIPGEIESLEDLCLKVAQGVTGNGELTYEQLVYVVSQAKGIEEPTTQEVFIYLAEQVGYEVKTPQQAAAISLLEEKNATYEPEEIKLTINTEDKTEEYSQNGFVEYAVEAGKEYEIELSIDGRIATKTVQITEGVPYNWDTNKVAVREENGTYIPVPRGFEVSTETNEDEISEGLVIKDGANEFVWVPVENSTTYTESSFGPLIKDMTLNNDEVDIDSYQSIQYYYGNSLGEINSEESFNKTFTYNEDKENVERSIRTYGGFYVGRYETTYDSLSNGVPQGIGVKQGKNVLQASNILQTGTNTTNNEAYYYRWWGLYKVQKDLYANNANVGSMMISSNQWDEMMTFTDYGDVLRPTDSYTNGPDLSGSAYSTDNTKYDEAKNIYDLAGNLSEWTIENIVNLERTGRGGAYYDSNEPASSDYTWGVLSAEDILGSRITLYIK